LSGHCEPHVSQWSDECIAMASALIPILTDIILRIMKELSSSSSISIASSSSSSPSVSSMEASRASDDKDAKRLLQLELISYVECCAVIDIIRQQLKVAFV
jgi:hypothetical protein